MYGRYSCCLSERVVICMAGLSHLYVCGQEEELEEIAEELLEVRRQLGLPELTAAELQQIKSDMDDNVELLEEMESEQHEDGADAAERGRNR